MKRSVVLSLSGGMDSTTLLFDYLNEGREVHPIFFQYGSKHNQYEKAAVRLIKYHAQREFPNSNVLANFKTIDVSHIFKHFKSNLLKSGGEIPEGHYEDENMKKTVIPGRNLIFASIMAGHAESKGVPIVSLGVHSGDHHIYPDCRPEFISSFRRTVMESSGGKVCTHTPFIAIDKHDILKLGYFFDIPVPYHLTRTCYKDQYFSCGKCGSCTERLEAFKKLGLKDPIHYMLDIDA